MQAAQTATPPSFDTVWALVKEVAENQKETDRQMKETDRQLKEVRESQRESFQENDRVIKEVRENLKETDQLLKKSIKDYDRRFGSMENRFGEVVESMLSPNLIDKFNDLGLDFQTAYSNSKVRDHKNKIYFEIDVLLQNTDTAMLVEIKTNLSINYINEHIERMEKMRLFADLRGDKRIFLGAVAGVVIPPNVKEYALSNGFYLIEPYGDNLSITSPYTEPKKW
jgi:hypothetical protein